MTYIPIEEPRSPAEMGAMSRDDLARLTAQRQEATARPSLVEALIQMGRFDEALQVTSDASQIKWIKTLWKAEIREDDHRCGCKSKVDCTDYVRLERLPQEEREAAKEERETPNYVRSFRFWSTTRNTYMTFYKCQECGCVQALPDDTPIDEFHAKHYELQQVTLTAELKKTPVRRL